MELNDRLTDDELNRLIWGLKAHGNMNRTLAGLVELRERRESHTDFLMPSRISDIELRSPLEVEDMYRAILRHMFARAAIALHPKPETEPTLPPPEEFTCDICSRTTTHPEGWHYCHRKDNDND